MIEFAGRGILLDIEGTTSSIRFVTDVMFPLARRELTRFLASRWNDPEVQAACELVARDAGHASLREWLAGADDAREIVAGEVLRQMDADAKRTGLKQLQGLIWEAGFRSGELRSHVFADVPSALEAWRDAGCDLRIYSSGSVQAQRLFFEHCERGDLLPFFSGHYDTTIGGKREPASYEAIPRDWGLAAEEILFLSDIPAELQAARQAGMSVALCLRPGNAPASEGHGFATLESFAEVRLAARPAMRS